MSEESAWLTKILELEFGENFWEVYDCQLSVIYTKMFECLVYLNLPLEKYPDVQIAKYEFDPGLQPGQKVDVNNLCWGFGGGESLGGHLI